MINIKKNIEEQNLLLKTNVYLFHEIEIELSSFCINLEEVFSL